MAEPVEMDWRLASELLDLAPMGGTRALLNAVAQALADEREKARAPFLAFAETLTDWGTSHPDPDFRLAARAAALGMREVAKDRQFLPVTKPLGCEDRPTMGT